MFEDFSQEQHWPPVVLLIQTPREALKVGAKSSESSKAAEVVAREATIVVAQVPPSEIVLGHQQARTLE